MHLQQSLRHLSQRFGPIAVELCQLAGVRHLCMYHHEPTFDDAAITRVLADTRRFEEITRTGAPLHVTAAYDGMEIAL